MKEKLQEALDIMIHVMVVMLMVACVFMIAELVQRHEAEATVPKVETVVYVSTDSKALIKKVFGNEWPLAVAIAMAESHMRPDAIGDKHLAYIGEDGKTYGYSVGLFQIQLWSDRPPAPLLLDAYTNIMCAYDLRVKRGWTQWSSYTNGSYKKFLPVLRADKLKQRI